ncbi:hypothetical protein MTR_0010s0210 [Medicago truncatula]|uniref:Uncharacterized protein n=1 Tax=Medicago truncatula TaxID=3880 RepID=A0A072TK02_MEDTR|nr:hypothetical protein MTR_0010s0210 [Medicago truncatula]
MASNLLALYCVVALLDRKERCDVYMSNCSSCWFCGVRHIFKSFNSEIDDEQIEKMKLKDEN